MEIFTIIGMFFAVLFFWFLLDCRAIKPEYEGASVDEEAERVEEELHTEGVLPQHKREEHIIIIPSALLLNLGQEAHNIAMKALPPVKSFQEEDITADQNCVICMEDFKNGELIQPFGVRAHVFHSSCLDSWLQFDGGKTICPICRQDLSIVHIC